MLNGEQPTIFGDGKQSRDFTYIENVVSANLLAASAPADRVSGKSFNVAVGQSFSLLQMYDLLRRLTGFQKQAQFVSSRVGDVKDSLADITSSQQALRYEPAVEFEEGLRRTVEWYKQNFAPVLATH
jgi:UDP-glucose 4-epimerase